ncbi:Uncharacterized protein conserved in bacteria (DUF2186) [Mycobacteroides abscessus subsp. bolletii]|nr:Uncharacterized protein conserved in bacteria (DUF2186) [Mycobacteroides abscessus subsp. bolletii]
MVRVKKIANISAFVVYLRSLNIGRVSVGNFPGGDGEILTLLLDKATKTVMVPFSGLSYEDALEVKKQKPDALFIIHRILSDLEHARWASSGLNFIDMAGNLFIRAKGIYLRIEGKQQVLKALKSGGETTPAHNKLAEIGRAFSISGLKVLFVLLVEPDSLNWTVAKIATTAHTSTGTVSTVFKALESEGYLAIDGRYRKMRHQRNLQRRWIEHYISTLKPSLKSRWVQGLNPQEWRIEVSEGRVPGAIMGGENALALKTGMIAPITTLFYGQPPWKEITTAYRLKTAEEGNTELREIFWEPHVLTPDRVVPDLLIYADSVATRDSRQIEIAQNWMDAYG